MGVGVGDGLGADQVTEITGVARQLVCTVAGDRNAVQRIGTVASATHDGVVVVAVVASELVRFLVGTDGRTARSMSCLLRVYSQRRGMPRCDLHIIGPDDAPSPRVAWRVS